MSYPVYLLSVDSTRRPTLPYSRAVAELDSRAEAEERPSEAPDPVRYNAGMHFPSQQA